VSFTEPNIQNVPKDFEIQMATVVGESPPSQDGRQAANQPGYVRTTGRDREGDRRDTECWDGRRDHRKRHAGERS